MTRDPASIENQVKVLKWERVAPLTQEEAEARLHQEGYKCFCWYDVPGVTYPRHQHTYDECLWILRGHIEFTIDEVTHVLSSGDRIYLPAKTLHTAQVPLTHGVTFLVGQKSPSPKNDRPN
jgi:mannose-6-phosphate isomerase-like protein (cupin superfamily)